MVSGECDDLLFGLSKILMRLPTLYSGMKDVTDWPKT